MSSIKQVIEGGFCVGCGNCAYLLNHAMKVNEYGEYIPDIDLNSIELESEQITKSCPSLHPEINENFIAKSIYGKKYIHDNEIGYFKNMYAAHVNENSYREKGSSGSIGTWILVELLKKKMVDGVIHVKKTLNKKNNPAFYEYAISKDISAIKDGSQSRYHVVEMSNILKLLEKDEGKFVFVGVTCMCKSLRRMQMIDERLNKKIPFVISLICGHLKSINWSLSLGWGAGISPNNLKSIDYRTKSKNINPRSYVFKATDTLDKNIFKDSKKITGGRFNAGAMMLPACNYCDDVVGETSDLTIGDAWLPKFINETRGKNLLITRSEILDDIINNANDNGQIFIEKIKLEDAKYAQRGCLRQRNEGLKLRLSILAKKKFWAPIKRVDYRNLKMNILRKIIYLTRYKITEVSRISFYNAIKENNYNHYSKKLRILTVKLRFFELLSLLITKLMFNFKK